MILLVETAEDFRKEFCDVLRTFFDDSNGSEDGFFSNVGTIVRNAL